MFVSFFIGRIFFSHFKNAYKLTLIKYLFTECILILFGMNSQHGRTPFSHWGCITQSQGLAENIVYFVSNAVACIRHFRLVILLCQSYPGTQPIFSRYVRSDGSEMFINKHRRD